MEKKKILVVDDDKSIITSLVDQFESLGYEVYSASDGRDGLKKINSIKPDLVILDIKMPDMSGLQVCSQIKSSPETKSIPILMLTVISQTMAKVTGLKTGADDYLTKPFEGSEIEARVEALLRRAATPPYSIKNDECTITLNIEPGKQVTISSTGILSSVNTTKKTFEIDVDAFGRQIEKARSKDQRFTIKESGKQVYTKIFEDHKTILKNYTLARGNLKNGEDLHLVFESTRDFFKIPVEYIYGGLVPDREYLVLTNPIARRIKGIAVNKPSISPGFLNELWDTADPLKILLIASNTDDISGVDEEIEILNEQLKIFFDAKNIYTDIKVIPTSEATYENVKNVLKNCHYHILHYAGHGVYDEESPEKSSLKFRDTKNSRIIGELTAAELKMLIRVSEIRFVYLSCCYGVTTGESNALLNDDLLGIADGIISTGVPAVLGYRWPVSDERSKLMALNFYKSLADKGKIDTALFDARCEVAVDRDDMTWISPVLIMQS